LRLNFSQLFLVSLLEQPHNLAILLKEGLNLTNLPQQFTHRILRNIKALDTLQVLVSMLSGNLSILDEEFVIVGRGYDRVVC